MAVFRYFLIIAILVCSAFADTPANCSYEDIRGRWLFHEGPRGNDKTVDCTADVNITSAIIIKLEFPNTAIDEDGNVGFWTIIYNQGFEVVINNRKYFAFSYFTQNADEITSICVHTFYGWSHAVGVNPRDWSCYIGAKLDAEEQKKTSKRYADKSKYLQMVYENKLYKKNSDLVQQINKAQSSWAATHYEIFEGKKISELVKMAGGKKSLILGKPKPAPVDEKTLELASKLPDSFDWRNVNGVSYVSPIRNQGSCGSCYAFASMAMSEARLRIYSNNTQQTVFSTQDIVECSQYSQGCDGGFPYLVGGKYAEDYGLVEEQCNPYRGVDGKCNTKTCPRKYSTKYNYIGGFYGACNEASMKVELVNNGPIAVSFEVYDDFLNYKAGVYHHTFLKDNKNFPFNPFELTNHVVIIVGYGTDKNTKEPYWLVKNSWGTSWGEEGFFRIRRGTDECAIESIAVASQIIV